MNEFAFGFACGAVAVVAIIAFVLFIAWAISGDSSFGGPPPVPPGYRRHKGRNVPMTSAYAGDGLPQPSPPPPPKRGDKFKDLNDALDKLLELKL